MKDQALVQPAGIQLRTGKNAKYRLGRAPAVSFAHSESH